VRQPFLRHARRAGASFRQWLFPPRELAAWRHACRIADAVPRYTPGEIVLDGYRLAYADLLTLCPQWRDMFVDGSLRFTSTSPSPRILDCGANVGLASLYFKRLYPQARITAYEADPALAALCQRNLTSNGAGDVDVAPVAVWTHDGVVSFQLEGADSGAIAGTSAGLAAKPMTVPSIRFRNVIAGDRIDLIKMDIEGAEVAVLTDCQGALDSVRAMILDVHEFDSRHRRTPEILGLLERAGFRVSMSNVVPLPSRTDAPVPSPFPGKSDTWAATVRAWRDQ
jgi:FkbM family methyltransferase